MSVKFSLIVPIFNVEKYLRKCLDSLANQEYENYEVILVDDGSTDSCGKMVDAYVEKYSIFKAIHKINEGLGEARNSGIEIASGDYIIFVDSDDWIEKNYLCAMNEIIMNKKADVVHCGWYEDTQNFSEFHNDTKKNQTKKEVFLNEMLKDNIGCQVWKNVYKKSLWNGIRFPKRLYEELYTTHRVINKAQRIVQSENGYYHYLVREDNISNSFNPIKGRDIFYGFVSRYEFLENIDVGIDVYSIVFEKMSINGIQAIHGLCLIGEIEEINKVADYVLIEMKKNFRKVKNNRLELIIAKNFTGLYAYFIRFFYKYVRRVVACA